MPRLSVCLWADHLNTLCFTFSLVKNVNSWLADFIGMIPGANIFIGLEVIWKVSHGS